MLLYRSTSLVRVRLLRLLNEPRTVHKFVEESLPFHHFSVFAAFHHPAVFYQVNHIRVFNSLHSMSDIHRCNSA